MDSSNIKEIALLPETDIHQLACIAYSLSKAQHNEFNLLFVAQNIHNSLVMAYPSLSLSAMDKIGTIVQERVKNMFHTEVALPIEDRIEHYEAEEDETCFVCDMPLNRIRFRDDVFHHEYCSRECMRRFME